MRYCTEVDLLLVCSEDEINRIADRTDDGQWIADTTTLNAVFDQVSGDMDGFFSRGGLTTPLSTCVVAGGGAQYPPVVVGYACDLAHYRLFNDAATAAVGEKYKNAMAWLTDVSKSAVRVIYPDGTQAAMAGRRPRIESNTRLFTRKIRY